MPTISMSTMLESLQGLVALDNGPLMVLLMAVCYVAAFIFGIQSLLLLKAAAEDGRAGYRGPLFAFLAACLMASAPQFIKSVAVTAYGDSMWGQTPLSYAQSGSTGSSAFKSVISVVSFIGYCFFIRGIWILKEAGEPNKHQQSTVGKAIVTLMAGMMAIYIDVTLKMLAGTFGWNVSAYLN